MLSGQLAPIAFTAIPLILVILGYLLAYFLYIFLSFFHLLVRFFSKNEYGAGRIGYVYNSITKKPVSLAIIRVLDKKSNKVVATKVTDGDGRYDLSIDPGEYLIKASKPKYKQVVIKKSLKNKKFQLDGHIEMKRDGYIRGELPMASIKK